MENKIPKEKKRIKIGQFELVIYSDGKVDLWQNDAFICNTQSGGIEDLQEILNELPNNNEPGWIWMPGLEDY